MSRRTPSTGMAPRRQLTLAVVACVVAAGVALFAASRTWIVEVRPRPTPLPAVSVSRTGGDLAPVLPSLAFVALAGASGLVAARGRGRSVVGALLVASGAGMAAAAVVGGFMSVGSAVLADGATAEGEPWAFVWATAGVLAGAAVAAVGVTALRRGMAWPAMGTAYERRRPAHSGAEGRDGGRDDGRDDGRAEGRDDARNDARNEGRDQGSDRARDQASDQDMWDALDRRIDPTGDNTSRMDD
jgi:uncharacterized membrane protein (TIGR02234 family)